MAGKARTMWVADEHFLETGNEAAALSDSSAARLFVALAKASLLGLPSPLPRPALVARLLAKLREAPATMRGLSEALGVPLPVVESALASLSGMLPGEVALRDADGVATWVYEPASPSVSEQDSAAA